MTTRRAALASLAALSAGGAVATVPVVAAAQVERSIATDADLLNFALNLEYLKAEFYGFAAFGKGLEDSNIDVGGSGAHGATVGGSLVTLHGNLLTKSIHQLAHDEAAHVGLLRATLGGDAVAKPLLDLGGLGVGFKSMKELLSVARTLEDVTVSAYAGIIPQLQSKETAMMATRLLAAEAQHAGNVRLLSGLKGVTATSFDPRDVLPPPAGNNVFSLDKSALAMVRSPGDILAIVKPFFPRGLNGTLR